MSLFEEEGKTKEIEIAYVKDLADELKYLTLDELKEADGIGEKVAETLHEWVNKEENQKYLQKLDRAGVKLTVEGRVRTKKLKNKSFVITGTLPTLSRDEAKDLIKQHGGKSISAVSKNTDYVLAGTSPGSKYELAKKLEIKIIDEEELLKMVK